MPQSVTIPVIVASDPTTRCSAWRRIHPISGMPNSALEMRDLGWQPRGAGHSFANVPPEIRELRVRADAGFGFNPVLVALEARPAEYAVVARLTQAFKRLLPRFDL